MAQMYSVKDFCREHAISRSFLYSEWKAGRGPAYVKVGKRRLISAAAAEAWVHLLGLQTEKALRNAA